jgi:thiol-disulfide isomerase/thioredoxin
MKLRRAAHFLVLPLLAALFVGGYWFSESHAAGSTSPPLAGDMGQFKPADPPQPAPALQFTDGDGNQYSLADFKGRVVLVNLWATWCVPCVKEMPSLDRLQTALGGKDFTVLAISQDRGGARVVDPFLDKLGLSALKRYLDPKGTVGRAFAVRGLPTSVLIDRDGRELGRLEGGAEWDGPAAQAMIKHYLDQGAPADGGVVKTSAQQ